MRNFFSKPLNWFFTAGFVLLAAMGAFVGFQPVQVIPRMAYGPEYDLTDQQGARVTEETLAGTIVLFGFGYTYDPTDTLDRTVEQMRGFQQMLETEGLDESVQMGLLLFDDERDTVERRQTFAEQEGLDAGDWLLLSGDAAALKNVIGGGFNVYYDRVPLEDLLADQPELAAQFDEQPGPDDYAFLQAERFVLVDERNIIRAEYRMPLDSEMALRDISYIIREKNATGASRALNEAAHLFLCYPQ